MKLWFWIEGELAMAMGKRKMAKKKKTMKKVMARGGMKKVMIRGGTKAMKKKK